MSLEMVMNEDGELDHGSGSVISGGTFTITSSASTKVKPGGKGCYRGPLLYTFAGGDAAGFVDGSVATTVPQTINPTAVKVDADGLPIVRLGDSGTMACVGTFDPPAVPPTGAVGGLVEVSDAGQDKVAAQ